MFTFVTKPKWVRKLYGNCTWEIKSSDKVLYLTFDDGPVPGYTEPALDILDKYNAKATFFCIGKNAQENPGLLNRITSAGHSLGNHTYSHFDGWKTKNELYFADITKARDHLDSSLFRPPFGHITARMTRKLSASPYNLKVILWDVLSADFDPATSPEKCLQNVVNNAKPGSIVLFHDTAAASANLLHTLPAVLKHFSGLGYLFQPLAQECI